MSAPTYRTPGSPEFVEALGWCLWVFLNLEVLIVRWLWLLSPATSLSEWRKQMAFAKGKALQRAAERADLPGDLRDDLIAWVADYHRAVQEIRNVIAHGHAFTVDDNEDGWGQGLAYTDRDGRSHTVARSPEQLHAIAADIERVASDLSAMEPRLQVVLDGRREPES